MGKRGPGKTPTAELIARGSWRAKDRKKEPVVEVGIPECPEWVSLAARRYWARWVMMLYKGRVISERDADALGNLCEAQAHYVMLRDDLAENPKDAGHPAHGVVMKARADVDRYLRGFGMTPSSRADIEAIPDENKDDFGAEFFGN
jgi:P27 family predicted phage terminase small subunit